MSFGLGRGRVLDDAPGNVGVLVEHPASEQGNRSTAEYELPILPDEIANDATAGYIDPRAWFAMPDYPLEIEIGSGKGTFLVQQAMLQPETNFLGIEWAHEFYLYAADRVRRRRQRGMLNNVRVLHTDATSFFRWRMSNAIVSVVHLYFSDPWPKKRHHKKRVIQDRFLADVWRVLKPGCELRVVTDHDELWQWDCVHFDRWTSPAGWAMLEQYGFACAQRESGERPASPFCLEPFDKPDSAGRGELVGTNFERKFRREGRGFHAAVLRKTAMDECQ